jgi:formylglycine-generating enzyme required for sulfatase activity
MPKLKSLSNSTNSKAEIKKAIMPEKSTWPKGMVYIPGGEFTMGSIYSSLEDAAAFEQPPHKAITKEFFMDTTEVTQKDYVEKMRYNPSNIKNLNGPVQCNWGEAILYCNARSKHEKKDTVYKYNRIIKDTTLSVYHALSIYFDTLIIDHRKNGYRLPCELEFEYACLAGKYSRAYFKPDSISNYEWNYYNSKDSIQNVATKKANNYNLFDMCGNEAEHCIDSCKVYDTLTQLVPDSMTYTDFSGKDLIVRAGGCGNDYEFVNCKHRGCAPLYKKAGFRCVKNIN